MLPPHMPAGGLRVGMQRSSLRRDPKGDTEITFEQNTFAKKEDNAVRGRNVGDKTRQKSLALWLQDNV